MKEKVTVRYLMLQLNVLSSTTGHRSSGGAESRRAELANARRTYSCDAES